MASAKVVETSVTNNSPSQDSYHPDDLFQLSLMLIAVVTNNPVLRNLWFLAGFCSVLKNVPGIQRPFDQLPSRIRKVLDCIKLNEDDTTSSSRVFIKILFQELAEFMGLPKLNERLKDPDELREHLKNAPKAIMAQQRPGASDSDSDSSDDSSSEESSSSDESSDSSEESSEDDRKERHRKKQAHKKKDTRTHKKKR
ncbi:Pre-mRNA-splicing factor CWC22-like protein [Acropora cervicornis]|uniref:Pre-mRNA-splicing factor CWC22-like protein n=1 Tax=Acropora cervicornis TaxID=6130 RepID=A0AAD9UWN2_ACRCE|nr:Pre-mRNA-splicing factor CWC22-like protein [Acropora cervicornis]